MDYGSYRGRGRDKMSGAFRPIGYLPETSEWVDKIYRLEDETDQYTADDVLGGVDGIDNAAPQALANRTRFLKDQLVLFATILSAMQDALSPVMATIKRLAIQKEAPTDPKIVWLQLEEGASAEHIYNVAAQRTPLLVVTLENGQQMVNPVLEMTLEDGRTFYVRTDGVNVTVPKVSEYLEPMEG